MSGKKKISRGTTRSFKRKAMRTTEERRAPHTEARSGDVIDKVFINKVFGPTVCQKNRTYIKYGLAGAGALGMYALYRSFTKSSDDSPK